MLPKKLRLRVQDFPAAARRIFSGKTLQVKGSRNQLGHNRLAVVISAGRVKKAVKRHLLRRRVLARAVKLPDAGLDILFIGLSMPASKLELDAEFDRIRAVLK